MVQHLSKLELLPTELRQEILAFLVPDGMGKTSFNQRFYTTYAGVRSLWFSIAQFKQEMKIYIMNAIALQHVSSTLAHDVVYLYGRLHADLTKHHAAARQNAENDGDKFGRSACVFDSLNGTLITANYIWKDPEDFASAFKGEVTTMA